MKRQGTAVTLQVNPLIGLASYYTFIKWLLPLVIWVVLVGVSWWDQSQVEGVLLVTGLSDVLPIYLLSLFIVGWGLWLLRRGQRLGAVVVMLATMVSFVTLLRAIYAAPAPYVLMAVADIAVMAILALYFTRLEGMSIGKWVAGATALRVPKQPIELRMLHWLVVLYVLGQFIILASLLYAGVFRLAPYLAWLPNSVGGLLFSQLNSLLLGGVLLLGLAAALSGLWQVISGADNERFNLAFLDLLLLTMGAKVLALGVAIVVTPILFYFSFCLDLLVLGYLTTSLSDSTVSRVAPWLAATFMLILVVGLFLL